MTMSKAALCKSLFLLFSLWILTFIFQLPSIDEVTFIRTLKEDGSKPALRIPVPKTDSRGNFEGDEAISNGNSKWLAQTPPFQNEQNTLLSTRLYTDRVAVTIEDRPLQNLIPVILHFHSVLGPEWPIILYTTPTSAMILSASASFARACREGWVEIRYLPETVVFGTHRAVSLFLSGPWLWQDLAPYDKVLLFQDDSILCSASAAQVDDFLEWDLIGAPIDAAHGRGFNGGLSIRNRTLSLDLVSRHSYATDSEAADAPAHLQFEDQWLYTRMAELPARGDGKPGAKLPPEHIARSFAVETIWEERPLGFHQPSRWQKDKLPEIMRYCPEVGMIGGAAFF